MLQNRLRTLLVAGGCLLALVVPGRAQDLFRPFLVDNISNYGGPPEARTGYWATAEALSWAVSPPEASVIGNDSINPPVVAVPDGSSFRTEFNTLNTTWLHSELAWGNRFQVGYSGRHFGWMIGGFSFKPATQRLVASDVDVVFPDPPFGPGGLGFLNGFIDRNPADGVDDDINGNDVFGRFFDFDGDGTIDPDDPQDRLPSTLWDFGDAPRLPVVFDHLYLKQRSDMWGLEIMPYYRTNPTHRAGYFEFGAGVRYLKYFERFDARGEGGALDETEWYTWAGNNIIGPQLSARWFRSLGRVTLGAETRYLFGFNYQTIRQMGRLATQLADPDNENAPRQNVPLNLNQGFFTHSAHPDEFSSVVEVRLLAGYQLTRALSASIGWTGMFADGIARPANMVQYQLPTFGIDTDNNRQHLFINGITFGVELNR